MRREGDGIWWGKERGILVKSDPKKCICQNMGPNSNLFKPVDQIITQQVRDLIVNCSLVTQTRVLHSLSPLPSSSLGFLLTFVAVRSFECRTSADTNMLLCC